MLFFPYRVDLDLQRTPWVTIAVCLVCIVVFIMQIRSNSRYEQALGDFCGSLDRVTLMIIDQAVGSSDQSGCSTLFAQLRDADDSEQAIAAWSLRASGLSFYDDDADEQRFIQGKLRSSFGSYLLRVPQDLTEAFAYKPLDRKIMEMLTSVITHGSLGHLVFNLLFFFAFAAAVEVIVGPFWFLAIIGVSAVSTSLAYSNSVAGSVESLPTIGLSGVVMAMMALLAVLAPAIRIRCFFWFIVIFKVFRVPALLLALWYLVGDLMAFDSQAESRINYVAHISGAVTGAVLGAGLWIFARSYLRRVLTSL